MLLTPLHLVELVVLGFAAGSLGALTGIGGGIVVTPILTLFFGVPIHQAIGTSLCCVIATSSGAAAQYVEHRLADIRLGMTLELATTAGAVSGAFIAGLLSREALSILFAALLVYSGGAMVRRSLRDGAENSTEPGEYRIRRLPLGLLGSAVAGLISGLLGIGGGPVKVPVMYLWMDVPFKVATATSNFMIGVTAAASAFVYYSRGDVRLPLTAATATGVFAGASAGTYLMRRASSRSLTLLFSIVLFGLAVMLVERAAHGGFTE